jgi:hypothetical protein
MGLKKDKNTKESMMKKCEHASRDKNRKDEKNAESRKHNVH